MKVQRFHTEHSVSYTQNKIRVPPMSSGILHNHSIDVITIALLQPVNVRKTFASAQRPDWPWGPASILSNVYCGGVVFPTELSG
jgi:hypothetical protein